MTPEQPLAGERDALVEDCEHPTITTYRYSEPEHETFGRVALWACAECRRKFVPFDAARMRAADDGVTVRVEDVARRMIDGQGDYQTGDVFAWADLSDSDRAPYIAEARRLLGIEPGAAA